MGLFLYCRISFGEFKGLEVTSWTGEGDQRAWIGFGKGFCRDFRGYFKGIYESLFVYFSTKIIQQAKKAILQHIE